jgi:hypothetical protein
VVLDLDLGYDLSYVYDEAIRRFVPREMAIGFIDGGSPSFE